MRNLWTKREADLGNPERWRGLLAAFDGMTSTRKAAAVLKWRELLADFASARDAQAAADVRSWRRLLSDFGDVRIALQAAVGQPSASRCTFNVFEVTRRRDFEVTTHSALICDLLDPRGSHGQGGAFLQAFLELIDAALPADPSSPRWPAADGWWQVAPEAPTRHGRLDILLTNRGPGGLATIVVENKWNHHLGDEQLERYGEYLAGLAGTDQLHRRCLVYLTRTGEDPSVSLKVRLVCLSHSRDISQLIRRALSLLMETAPPGLREPLTVRYWKTAMADEMDLIVSFFHERDNLARARELREALDQFETRMPDRIGDRVLSMLPAEERAPAGWSRFQRFLQFRENGFHGWGWERGDGSGALADWVGFGWWHVRDHDYLLYPQDLPGNPCRWIGWWRPGVESQTSEEARLFDRVHSILARDFGSSVDAGLFDEEAQHDDGWPYYHGVPATSPTDALRVDTDEFAAVLARTLPLIRRAVDEAGR